MSNFKNTKKKIVSFASETKSTPVGIKDSSCLTLSDPRAQMNEDSGVDLSESLDKTKGKAKIYRGESEIINN